MQAIFSFRWVPGVNQSRSLVEPVRRFAHLPCPVLPLPLSILPDDVFARLRLGALPPDGSFKE